MDIEDYNIVKIEDEKKFKLFLEDLLKKNYQNINEINSNINILRRKYKIYPSKKQLRYYYNKYFNKIKINQVLSRFMIKKSVRSKSGVLVIKDSGETLNCRIIEGYRDAKSNALTPA